MKWPCMTGTILAALFGLTAFPALTLAKAGTPAVIHRVPCPATEVDSSTAIQAALEAAGVGEIVTLDAGTYYLANPVWVRTPFNGAIRGAGKDRTFIKVLPGARIGGVPISILFPDNHYSGASLSTLFYFDIPMGQTGDITASDFSLLVTDPAPGGGTGDEDWFNGALFSMVVVTGETVNTAFERLHLSASTNNAANVLDHGFNVRYGILVAGRGLYWPPDNAFGAPMTGTHKLAQVDLENMTFGYDNRSQKDSVIKVEGNGFTNVAAGPLIQDQENSQVAITSNKLQAWAMAAAYIIQGNGGWWPFRTSTYVLEHNDIRATEWADGIAICDYAFLSDGWIKVATEVSHNTLSLDTNYGGIYLGGVQGAVVANNKVSGQGLAGIYAAPWGWDLVGKGIFKANQVNQLAASVAPIWLGSGSSSCYVIGGNASANVLDEGTGNVLTGVNRVPGQPVGPAVSDAMKRRSDMLKLTRGPKR